MGGGFCVPQTLKLLVARAEGKTPEILAKLLKDIEAALATSGLNGLARNRTRT